MAPVSDFQGLISNYPATFTAVTLIDFIALVFFNFKMKF